MIDYSESWLIFTLLKWKGSVFPRSCLFAVPAALIAVFLVQAPDVLDFDIRQEFGLVDAHRSQLWIISLGVLHALLVFRINRAMERFWEGTGLLHQMRGEWFDAVSCCVTFSRASMLTRPQETMRFRHAIVRLMSLCHGSALEEIGGEDGDFCETIDSHGLATRTLQHLTDCAEEYDFNRVEVLLHMIQSLITHNLDVGVLKVQPPILSRVYQTLSRGFVNLLNAKKIADTRFPFPFAQLISALLFLHIVLLPVLISAVISQAWLAFTFTFLPIFSMCCLNYIGVELENPFGRDANDLPLKHFQAEMNNCLLMLLHGSADLMAGISKQRCLMDIMEIRQAMDITLAESWLQETIDKAPSSPGEVANVKDVEEEDSLPGSTAQEAAGMEVVLPQASVQGEASSDCGAAPNSEEPAFEEKLQPTTLLQGMDQAVMALTGIRQAIAMQATDVDRSIDGFLALAKKLRKAHQVDDLVADEAEPADVEFSFGWDCSAIPSFEASG
ncbi:unnamed protein product [Symbiodinium pilosum]|uniref:Uncharacterized protein n=1 Tax=Symbiodinium pilosum TaxID=2952 RepID=A0A812QD09_SYMPI|nr:unnamed protein product [Symbiodinium pilosum]